MHSVVVEYWVDHDYMHMIDGQMDFLLVTSFLKEKLLWFSDLVLLWQSINFFTLGARLCLVDLPGYGFAYAKEETKEAWEDLVSLFFIVLLAT